MKRGVCRNEITALCGTLFCFLTIAGELHGQDQTRALLAKGQFTGGVVVHVHGADAVAAAIDAARSVRTCVGQLLVAEEADAGKAREALVAAGLHGKIHVGVWQSGTLPFIDNFVNLLIVEQARCGLSRGSPARACTRKGRPFSARRCSSSLARQRSTTGRCSCTTRPAMPCRRTRR